MCNQHEGQSSDDQPAATSPDGHAYAVKGMSCEHCAMSVTEEVEKVDGVTGVHVDVDAGRIVVSGEGFTDEAIRVAVDEAGYDLAAA